MRVLACVFLFLAMTVTPVSVTRGQGNESDLRTAGVTNGRAWRALGADWQLGYIAAFNDALILTLVDRCSPAASEADKKRAMAFNAKYSPLGALRNGETIEAIDRIYSDPVNLSLPISEALRIVILRIRDADEATTARELAASRQKYNR